MFAPPAVVETQVFARLPDGLRRSDTHNEWFETQPYGGKPGPSFFEGPSFERDGSLLFVDIPYGRILRASTDGVVSVVAEYDGWPNGLKIHRDGRVFVADYKNGIMLLDPVNGRVTPYLVRANLERFKGVNDLFFAANGDLWFTDQGVTGLQDKTGRVFRLKPDGTLTCVLDDVPSPNGLVMDIEERALFLAVTRANAVWHVPITAMGDPIKVGIYAQFSGGSGPDGLAIDVEGNLAVAHMGLGTVWLLDRRGEPLRRIKSCAGELVNNLAYGGPDGRTLFMTEAETGAILTANLDTPGKRMFSHT